jgi:hypothetical protein
MRILPSDVHVGRPLGFGALTIFPLFSEGTRPCEYLLADEGMEAGTLTVSEVSQQGSVPELVVENLGPQKVLFLEGEEVRGAKQNRVINATMLVPAHCKLTIPVSCVEQGRWTRTSTCFASSKTVSPLHLRHTLKSSVTEALGQKRGHRSDQARVWDEVRKQQRVLGVSSPTSALADTYAKYEKQRVKAHGALRYVPGACGLAVALGSQVVSLDHFDKPATCEKVWARLLSGLLLDALADGVRAEGPPDPSQVTQLVDEARSARWAPSEIVGAGQEFRATFDDKVGSALLLNGRLVHGSVVARLAEPPGSSRNNREKGESRP